MDPHAVLRKLVEALVEGDMSTATEHFEALKDWRERGGNPPRVLAVLPPEDLAVVSAALGDAYAYRLGEEDPNDLEALDPADSEPMADYQAFAEKYGVTFD